MNDTCNVINLRAFIVIPNHIHGIIVVINNDDDGCIVGTSLKPSPTAKKTWVIGNYPCIRMIYRNSDRQYHASMNL
jgi:REP element-mobilizing transposase RayT